MKKSTTALSVLLSALFLISTAQAAPSGEPQAIISIKNGNATIDIQNLNATPDEQNRLKVLLDKKIVRKNKRSGGIDVDMNIKITDSMLQKAGITVHGTIPAQQQTASPSSSSGNPSNVHIDINNRDKVKLFHNMNVHQGEKTEDIVLIGGNLELEGEADDVVVVFGNTKILPTAKINGDLVTVLGNTDIAQSASIKGSRVTVGSGKSLENTIKFLVMPGAALSFLAFTPFLIALKLFCWLITIGLALVLFHLFPTATKKSKDYFTAHPLASFGYGILYYALTIPFLLILLCTIIGIPFIPLVCVALVLIAFWGYAIVALRIGSAIPFKFFKENEVWSLVGGIILLGLLCFIPILGHIVKFVVLVGGFGAVMMTIFKLMHGKKKS